jgi:hypothetical protein
MQLAQLQGSCVAPAPRPRPTRRESKERVNESLNVLGWGNEPAEEKIKVKKPHLCDLHHHFGRLNWRLTLTGHEARTTRPVVEAGGDVAQGAVEA